MDLANLNMYDTLLQLPLFQGMGRDDLVQVVGHTRFAFSRHRVYEVVAREGERCQALLFLIRGTLHAVTAADDKRMEMEETVYAPDILQPEHLFGLTQRYSMTFEVTSQQCDILSLGKGEVNRLLGDFEIFRTNFLNIVSAKTQRLSRTPWKTRPRSIREKLARFFVNHCRYPAGEKICHITMQTLANEIGESRLNVSKELHQLEKENLIVLARERVCIPRLENLFM
ncbi:MAG: Crp/Fnr family transcriptional regulator [Prevotella sp.]|nr:Crp/Fnr family transcriptional regulator [Prevotella sp.]